MIFLRHRNMALWALRDLMRRPAEALLTAGVLILLAVVMGAPLIVSRILSGTIEAVLAASPAMVVRQTDPTGWRPIPVSAAAAASRIPGAIDVRPRIWGRVASESGPVTVMAWLPPSPPSWPAVAPDTVVSGGAASASMTLFRIDGSPRVFRVAGHLPTGAGLPATDLVIMHPQDARQLLNIPEDHATDLTVDVFHEAEIPAVAADLTAALPFPVHIDDRRSAVGRHHAAMAARSGAEIARCVPAVVATVLLVLVNLRQAAAGAGEAALLRAMGWSAADIHRRHRYAALWVGLPAVGLGTAAAYALAVVPDLAPLGALLWGDPLPPVTPGAVTADLALVLAAIATLVLLPYLLSVSLAGLMAAVGQSSWPPAAGGRP